MKKVLISLLCLFACCAVSAETKKCAVEMVAFEQRVFDAYSSVSLKNNTTEDIHNVTFQITYYDMEGQEIDYQEFTEEIEIEPGKTKKLDIPAYERDRHYQYYKNKRDYLDYPTFKVEYELKGYNTASPEPEATPQQTDSFDVNKYTINLMSIMPLVMLAAYIGLFFVVANMARRRNRSVAAWLLIAFFGSPILAIFIMLIAGDNDRMPL